MKKGIHPRNQTISVLLNDGSTLKMEFTIIKHKNKTCLLEVDSTTHAYWNASFSNSSLENSDQLSKFKKRFKSSNVLK